MIWSITLHHAHIFNYCMCIFAFLPLINMQFVDHGPKKKTNHNAGQPKRKMQISTSLIQQINNAVMLIKFLSLAIVSILTSRCINIDKFPSVSIFFSRLCQSLEFICQSIFRQETPEGGLGSVCLQTEKQRGSQVKLLVGAVLLLFMLITSWFLQVALKFR